MFDKLPLIYKLRRIYRGKNINGEGELDKYLQLLLTETNEEGETNRIKKVFDRIGSRLYFDDDGFDKRSKNIPGGPGLKNSWGLAGRSKKPFDRIGHNDFFDEFKRALA